MEVTAAGYQCVAYGQKAYNGVAILTREPLTDVSLGFATIRFRRRRACSPRPWAIFAS